MRKRSTMHIYICVSVCVLMCICVWLCVPEYSTPFYAHSINVYACHSQSVNLSGKADLTAIEVADISQSPGN